jgi:tetratricopeptide (TPR) repeat protein
MKRYKLIIPLVFYAFFVLEGEYSNFEYFNPGNIRSFAEYLFDDGQYLRAVGEYQRYLFATDSFPQNADSIFFKIALCYRFSENYKKSIDYFQKIASEYKESKLLDESYLEIGICYSLTDNFEESNNVLKSYFLDELDKKINTRAKQLITINHIQKKEWNQALEFLNDTNSLSNQLSAFVERGQNLPKKSRFVSGLFSAVIPGSGKYYCNRPMDGFNSFVIVGISGWQAYEGFDEDGIHSVKGWIFGVLGGIFYLGNIYGSVVAADIYNEEQETVFKLSVKKYMDGNFK